MEDWSAEALVALVGIVLSFVFAYFPWVKDWYESLDKRFKPLLMAGLLFVVSAGHLAFSCSFQGACMEANISRYFWVWVMAMVANQGAYAVGVRQFKQAEFWAD
jgi:phosphoglycerol transferase MdoB-like AlkP superfamily enzyme